MASLARPWSNAPDPELLRGTWLGAWRDLHDLLVAIELSGPAPDIASAFAAHERGLARALLDAVAPDAAPAELEAVQAALADDEALVSLALAPADNVGWAFVVTPDDARAVPLASRAVIVSHGDALVTALTARAHAPDGEPITARRARVAQADADIPELAAALAAVVWTPVARDLPERVVLVGDPALASVPFALLPGPGGAAAIDTHELIEAPSASAWLALRRRPATTAEGVLVVADPVFGSSDARVPGASALGPPAPFARLHFAAFEAAAIRRVAPSARVLSGLAARRDALLPGDGPPPLAAHAIIHFATHVVVDPVTPEHSGLVLSQVDADGAPLDGLLTARDARGLGLDADLVVLSGCASGLGRATRGEGVMGLARGFLEAGARTTLVSRWRVHDRGTARLMAAFYEGLRDGLGQAAALRRAALALRADPRWSAPYYWAAFTLIGAGDR